MGYNWELLEESLIEYVQDETAHSKPFDISKFPLIPLNDEQEIKETKLSN